MTPAFHLFLPQMRMSHDAIVERARTAEAVGLRRRRVHGPSRPAARGAPGHVGGDGDRRLGAGTNDLVARRPPGVVRRAAPSGRAGPRGHVPRPRIGRTVRARHRLGLRAIRARDVRGRLHRARPSASAGSANHSPSCAPCGPATSSTSKASTSRWSVRSNARGRHVRSPSRSAEPASARSRSCASTPTGGTFPSTNSTGSTNAVTKRATRGSRCSRWWRWCRRKQPAKRSPPRPHVGSAG